MEQPLSYFLKESKYLDLTSLKKNVNVAILSSFTINGLAETLQVKCNKKNISCMTYLGGYNQYNQEILDKNIQGIQENYPTDFELDTLNKIWFHECEPVLPIFDEKYLLDYIKKIKLSKFNSLKNNLETEINLLN